MLELIERITENLNAGAQKAESYDHSVLTHLNDIQNAVSFINEHLTEPLTLDDISHAAGLSRSHLSVLFKNVTGVSPYEYLLLQRIERAVRFLSDSDRTVIDIAQECGFRSLPNFNKAFKRVTGITPTDYRKSSRN